MSCNKTNQPKDDSAPMLLAVDVGNSHMVIGLFVGAQLTHHWRVKTDRKSTPDELAALFHSLFSMRSISFVDINDVILACVVPTMQAAWADFARQHFDRKIILVDNTMQTGMKVLTDNPADIGADRIVNAVAGFTRYKKALIIVDFGTAITLDCVSAKGEYLGGAIAPGLAISLDALSGQTAKLPRVDISTSPASAIGTNTVEAIKSGLLYGFGGMVEGLICRIKEEFQPITPMVISTGGMAGLISPYAPSIEKNIPMLTLEGLRLIYVRNS